MTGELNQQLDLDKAFKAELETKTREELIAIAYKLWQENHMLQEYGTL